MAELSPADFDEFFRQLWGFPPFQWQRDLASRVLTHSDAPWPQALALPTASGKTACLDIAVFALAAQADRLATGQAITAARRIFFVVDRRVIVDEAFERARILAQRLAKAQHGILGKVAAKLRLIAAGGADDAEDKAPLVAHVLRGGMFRSEAWAHDPLQPAIVASTVDQLGSRLLFRAYGRDAGMWPVYAGLATNDSLVLLDEAHCAQPFLQTLQAIARYRGWADSPLNRSFFPVVMSATPPAGLNRFEDSSAERTDPQHPLGRRQLARKPAALVEVPEAKGAKATLALAKALVHSAENLVDAQRRAIVIFVNRVATARAVLKLLEARPECLATLVTGRMRSLDKDAIVRERLSGLASSRSEARPPSETPHFVVSTQTLEVGADLDFDGLVSECASLDALRQRFGRLNRMGRPVEARAAIVMRADHAANSDDDPVYGHALAATWNWLLAQRDEHGEIDFGIAHLERVLPGAAALSALNAPAKEAPVILPAHIDRWSQTAPVPKPSPEVAPFLHGSDDGAADVQVCWRADIDLTHSDARRRDYALESLSLCPPSSAESLPVPIGVFRRWLAGHPIDDIGADIEGISADAGTPAAVAGTAARRTVIRWQGTKTRVDTHITGDPARIRPGDIIVVPAGLGGWKELGTLVVAEPTAAGIDIAEQAHMLARNRALLRLHPRLLETWPDSPARMQASTLLTAIATGDEDVDDATAVITILAALEAVPAHAPQGWRKENIAALRHECTRAGTRHVVRRLGSEAIFIVGRHRLSAGVSQADSFSDEDDATASSVSMPSGRPVRLRTHLDGVAAVARRFAQGSGLPEKLAAALETAARLHDLGKADPRFQALLRGGNRWLGGELLAKSSCMPQNPQAREQARKSAAYPLNGRHELLSVRLAESAPSLLPLDEDLRELVLHLIATHHGHCRPFAPVVSDDSPPDVTVDLWGQTCHWQGPTRMEHLESGTADRFWLLVRRYGWWGLAWLEALLRLADHRRSEWEEEHEAE